MPLLNKTSKQETHLGYYDLMKDMARKFNLRLEMVLSSREHGLSEAARRYQTPVRPSGSGLVAIKALDWMV